MTPRITFEHELEELKINLEEMGQHVESIYDRLFLAIGAGDKNAIRNIMKDDRVINDMEKHIEARCLTLITKQQPVARDLRVVSAALKVVTDLERVGDQVTDIAEITLRFDDSDVFRYSVHLATMADATKEQLHQAVEAFINRDMESATELIAGDDVIDDLFNKVKSDVIDYLRAGKWPADECIDLLMIAKYLEKIGDHAVNIADWECFQETGNIHNTRLL
ncbi:MAG: phosphate signaling complex protein PhoU [Lachnospiraceae bacterium]|nr:phosphate signaling complex protein PhoU [Lachnospiraceae bacterium]MDY4068854.1 phosphate signaling complex protein PhoU [Lachnospiraceae bacterium]